MPIVKMYQVDRVDYILTQTVDKCKQIKNKEILREVICVCMCMCVCACVCMYTHVFVHTCVCVVCMRGVGPA